MKSILLYLALTAVLSAEIHETKTIFAVNQHRDKDTLIIYDIDNTLMEPRQSLGSDQWFYHHFDELKKRLQNDEKALTRALLDWNTVNCLTVMKEVEPGTAAMIDSQQKEGAMVMALTTRDFCFSSMTLYHLDALGIQFTPTAPAQESMFFDLGNGALFTKGILFCGSAHKGKVLQQFLKAANIQPKKIVFINDKRSHIAQVEETCAEMDLPFIGLRYSYTDEKVKAFDYKITEVQHQRFFGQLLSDSEARRIISS